MRNQQERIRKAKLQALASIIFDCGSSGEVWLYKAFELKASAEVLFKKGEISSKARANPANRRMSKFERLVINKFHDSGFLLLGLAIENLLKGILIELEPSLVKTQLSASLANHNIPALLSKLPTTVRPRYSPNLADGLRAHVEWVSKYPIPKNPTRHGHGSLSRLQLGPALKLFDDLARVCAGIVILRKKDGKRGAS